MNLFFRISLLALFPVFTIFSCNNRVYTEIPLKQVEDFYTNMKEKGVNTDTTMLYGYFFTNETRKPLEAAAEELKKKKFQFVEIYQSDDSIYWLHVERKEKHNSTSLYALNKDLYDLASRYNLQSYDGYDVGNVDPAKAIETDSYFVPEDFSARDFVKDGYLYLLVMNNAFDKFSHKKEFCYFIKVNCNYDLVDEHKLPTDAELNSMDNLDHAIEGMLKAQNIKNYYVFRNTYKGNRNCFIAINNKEAADKAMKNFQQTSKIFSFNYEIIKDEKWANYDLAKKMQ
ncbi:ribonuclease E inhibitor RraB [Pedobacter gandavensis]|uniref:ribonuclease E inhibitor RraB n=1 Tax=Pedobacter gandavensis TaxID=2679963 RepID=UPI00292E6B89|nr:ribonuclease E inhibitor RraB [Pedobacter gandavensis]